jgi:crossover junction endodeoxyribonuclease RuvC
MGYGVVEGGGDGVRALDYGILTTSAELPLPQRLKSLYHGLSMLMERYQPREVAVELFVARNLRTALVVGEARGIALLAAAERGIPVYEYTPLQVKQQVSGYGRGDKRQVQEMVRIQLGLPSLPQPDDAADALAVALCHLQEAKLRKLITDQGGRDVI